MLRSLDIVDAIWFRVYHFLDWSFCSLCTRELINQAESLFNDGFQVVDHESMKSLTGRAYELLATGVRTGGQLTWQEELKPVLNENGATLWVKNEYVKQYLH